MNKTLPSFWYDPNAPIPLFYRIGAVLYGLGRRTHVALTHPAPCPLATICVGNVTAGGAGKTPIVQALRDLFKESDPVVLIRGYKGRSTGPLLVCNNPSAVCVGDEACLHRRDGPVIVSKNRYAGVLFAKQRGFTLVLMDDGLQNQTLSATVNLLVIDGNVGIGNNRLLPAGPLREPLATALNRTDAVLLIGTDKTQVQKKIPRNKAVFTAHTVYDSSRLDLSVPYIAFCGLARPEKFYNALRSLGVSVLQTIDFSDHHSYTSPDLNALLARAKQMNARLITTEKDFIKIPDIFHDEIASLPLKTVFDEPDQLKSFLQKILLKQKS